MAGLKIVGCSTGGNSSGEEERKEREETNPSDRTRAKEVYLSETRLKFPGSDSKKLGKDHGVTIIFLSTNISVATTACKWWEDGLQAREVIPKNRFAMVVGIDLIESCLNAFHKILLEASASCVGFVVPVTCPGAPHVHSDDTIFLQSLRLIGNLLSLEPTRPCVILCVVCECNHDCTSALRENLGKLDKASVSDTMIRLAARYLFLDHERILICKRETEPKWNVSKDLNRLMQWIPRHWTPTPSVVQAIIGANKLLEIKHNAKQKQWRILSFIEATRAACRRLEGFQSILQGFDGLDRKVHSGKVAHKLFQRSKKAHQLTEGLRLADEQMSLETSRERCIAEIGNVHGRLSRLDVDGSTPVVIWRDAWDRKTARKVFEYQGEIPFLRAMVKPNIFDEPKSIIVIKFENLPEQGIFRLELLDKRYLRFLSEEPVVVSVVTEKRALPQLASTLHKLNATKDYLVQEKHRLDVEIDYVRKEEKLLHDLALAAVSKKNIRLYAKYATISSMAAYQGRKYLKRRYLRAQSVARSLRLSARKQEIQISLDILLMNEIDPHHFWRQTLVSDLEDIINLLETIEH